MSERDERADRQAWDAIVADLSGEMQLLPQQREERPRELEDPAPEQMDFFDALDVIDAFVPPEPPPLRLPADRLVRAGWAGVLGGPMLVLAERWWNLGSFVTMLGGLAFLAGFTTLIARMRNERDEDHDATGGAVV
jgi:hypothetical protein